MSQPFEKVSLLDQGRVSACGESFNINSRLGLGMDGSLERGFKSGALLIERV